jgi:hypothetical protein
LVDEYNSVIVVISLGKKNILLVDEYNSVIVVISLRKKIILLVDEYNSVIGNHKVMYYF